MAAIEVVRLNSRGSAKISMGIAATATDAMQNENATFRRDYEAYCKEDERLAGSFRRL